MICALLAVALLAQVPAPREPVRADIDALRWMAGHWMGIETEDLSEELWLPPAANSMVGMWRWASAGQLRLFELLTISKHESGLALRLRHFRPDLTALEEKDKPFVLPLVSLKDTEAVFEGIGSDGGTLRIAYRRAPQDRLEASVERGEKVERFAYRLLASTDRR